MNLHTLVITIGTLGVVASAYVFPSVERRKSKTRPAEPWTPELQHTLAELNPTPIIIDYRPGCPCHYCASVRVHPSTPERYALGQLAEYAEHRRRNRPELGGE
jgi:hypothetical protein